MAAAEYFSNAPIQHHSSPYQGPTSHPQPIPNMNSPHPSPLQAPPPYQEFNSKPGVHFAPTPVDIHQRHSFSGQRPQPSMWNNSPQQPSPLVPYNHQHRPSMSQISQQQGYGTPPSYGSTPPRPQYLHPQMRPYANPNASQYNLDHAGYVSDPERDRHRHRHRRRRDSGESRDMKDKKSTRSTNSDAFIGAAGGGLIGDLIFPGLGTVGGAALGWLGGKDFGNHRKGRESKRAMEQRKWEEKYRPELHHRGSRSRSNEYNYDYDDYGRRRGSSPPIGERKHSYDNRY